MDNIEEIIPQNENNKSLIEEVIEKPKIKVRLPL